MAFDMAIEARRDVVNDREPVISDQCLAVWY